MTVLQRDVTEVLQTGTDVITRPLACENDFSKGAIMFAIWMFLTRNIFSLVKKNISNEPLYTFMFFSSTIPHFPCSWLPGANGYRDSIEQRKKIHLR